MNSWTHTHTMKKEAMDLKKARRDIWKGFEGEKKKGVNNIIIL